MSLLHNRNERHGVLPRVLYVVLVVYFEKLNRSYINKHPNIQSVQAKCLAQLYTCMHRLHVLFLCSFFSAWCVLESNFVINLQQSKIIVTSQAVTSHMNSFTMHDILFHSRTYHLHENILIPSNHVPADNNYAKCEKQSVKGQALQLIGVHMLMLMLQI
mgnify:CR=1 FL=1